MAPKCKFTPPPAAFLFAWNGNEEQTVSFWYSDKYCNNDIDIFLEFW